ncbi:MAG: hypothetical protein JNK72_03595 [Myxococcales bacterium]|nr:hypothetical protein [Myxococcales bacterium]
MRATRILTLLGVLSTAACTLDWDRLDPSQGPAPTTDAGLDAGLDAGGCQLDNDCAGNELGNRVCDTTSRVCVQCVAARDTCPRGQYCGADNRCTSGCRNDEACQGTAASTDAGADDAASTGTRATNRCNVSTRACVECLSNEHCPPGRVCMGNACVPGCDSTQACPSGQSCCGGGCVDLQASPLHCGACGSLCSTVNGTPACAAGRCAVGRCTAPFGDCDSDPSSGCETNTQTSVMHCGQCGTACPTPPNATAGCSAGRCGIAQCQSGFADCNGLPEDGCEVNINTSVMHCGRCANACVVSGGMAVCVAGACQRSSCDVGRGDCDGNTANGCEADLTSDPRHCATCGAACSLPNAESACAASRCVVGSCNTGFGNCDGNAQNGCEVDTRSSVTNCGTCGVSCAFARGTAACERGACAIASCDRGFGNCDNVLTNGCETDTNTSVTHCGTCGTVCPTRPQANAVCNSGACGIACQAGFADCDNNANTGCEQNTSTDVNHCGACNRRCVLANAEAACNAGTCAIARCLPGYADCDGSPSNGCEVNTRTDLNHCGGCGVRCAANNATALCANSTCQITACTGSFGNCDGNPANGCETDMIASQTHCGACGNVCPTGRTCTIGRCARAFNGYSVATAPSEVTWVEACTQPGVEVLHMGVDDDQHAGTIPFPVEFWGGLTRDYVVTSNGQVGFGTLFYGFGVVPDQGTYRSFGTLPISLAQNPPRGMVPSAYLFGVDLVQNDGVCVVTLGTAPNRRWVAETRNAYAFSVSGTAFSFELIAYEATQNIDFLYNAPWTTPFNIPVSGNEATIGLQDFRQPVRAITVTQTVGPGTRLRFSPL